MLSLDLTSKIFYSPGPVEKNRGGGQWGICLGSFFG